jgi:hypothetical protein
MLRFKRPASLNEPGETAKLPLPVVKHRLEAFLAQIEDVLPGVMPYILKFLNRRETAGWRGASGAKRVRAS